MVGIVNKLYCGDFTIESAAGLKWKFFICYFMNKMHHEMMFGNVEECKKGFCKAL